MITLQYLRFFEKYGFIWVWANQNDTLNPESILDIHLGAVGELLASLKVNNLHAFKSTSKNWQANWKLLTEGGLETYHFSFAHKNTIGPYFLNNTSVIDYIADHIRVAMPSKNIVEVIEKEEKDRFLRDFTHTLYSIFPQSAFLIQEKHIDWVRTRPVSEGVTEMIITSLIPDTPNSLSKEQRKYWEENFSITLTTLDEDFVLAESIQQSLSSGAISTLSFGRSEGALKKFNQIVDNYLSN